MDEDEILEKHGWNKAYCWICLKLLPSIRYSDCHECDVYVHKECALKEPAKGYVKVTK